METRSFCELNNYVKDLYESKDKAFLRSCAYKIIEEGKVKIFINDNMPAETPIIYGKGTNNEHEIELRVPGRLTYRNRLTRDITDQIQTYDFRIRIKNKRKNYFHPPKHVEIIDDLYKKVAFQEETLRKNNYISLAKILQNLYFDMHPFYRINTTEEEQYRILRNGFSLPELVTFIKWCGIEEDINYPSNNKWGKDDWGKDLLFARYFEAIYAGFHQDTYKLQEIKTRTKNKGGPKPELWDRKIYQGTLATRFDLEEI